jgi:hypothetical protein
MSSELASSMKTRALKIATIVALVVGAQAFFADGGQTDDDPNSVIKSLCRSKDAEGGYDWKLGGEAARIWVVCQSETRVLASINTLDSNYTLTMVHTAISRRNPDILSFATYDLSADGARTVNGRVISHAILRLSIQALRQGRAIGEFQRNAILPITVNAKRTMPLPSLLAETTPAGQFLPQFSGSFLIEEPSVDSVKRDFQLVKIKPPACLVTAVDGDLRSANLHDSGHLAILLPWGSADSDENVFYATNGVDDYFAGKDSVTQIRGVFLTSDLIEFFYFNSLVGLGGPFRAVRMNNQMLASNPCRPHL